MRTRNNDWVDTDKLKVWYGFDAWHDGQWHHAMEDGEPCLYETMDERDAKRAEWRKSRCK